MHGHGHQQQGRPAAQEHGLEPALQAHQAQVEPGHLLQLGETLFELPDAGGEPVDDHGRDGEGEHVAQKHAIERQIEQVELEGLAENGVVPGGGLGREIAPAEIADHGPGVDGGS